MESIERIELASSHIIDDENSARVGEQNNFQLPKMRKSILKKTSAYGASSNMLTNQTTQQPTSSHISFAIANEYGVNDQLNSASQSTIDYEAFDKGRAASVTHHADSAIELTRSMSIVKGEVGNETSQESLKRVKLDLKQPQLNTERLTAMLKSPSVELVQDKNKISVTSRRKKQTNIQDRSASSLKSGQRSNMYHTVRQGFSSRTPDPQIISNQTSQAFKFQRSSQQVYLELSHTPNKIFQVKKKSSRNFKNQQSPQMKSAFRVNLKTNMQGKRTIELRPTFNEDTYESKAPSRDEYDTRNSIFNATQLRSSLYNSAQTNDHSLVRLPKMEMGTYETKTETQQKDRTNTQNDIKMLVKRCNVEQQYHKKLMNEINHAQLVQGIQNKEERRTWKQMQRNELVRPRFMKELFRELHTQRQEKNRMQKEVVEDHRAGMSDPGQLAKKLEHRLYFKDYIKVDETGHTRHKVEY